jgi:hypothetical protein
MMFRRLLILCSAVMLQTSVAWANSLDLEGFQKPDGAITTAYGDTKVDPYFATLALLLAKDGELSIRKSAKAWIEWAIKQQQPEGLFNRYTLNENGGWDATSATDADDAMLALWIELLYNTTSKNGMPGHWKKSLEKAEIQLDSLYNEELGIYHISEALPVGLLMDNVEIALAFRNISKDLKRLGQPKKSALYAEKSDRLIRSIYQVFGGEKQETFLISTQEKNKDNFYPTRVSQIYPLLSIMPEDIAHKRYEAWMKENGKEWLKQHKEDYPWGLVAIAALSRNDHYSAACWKHTAEPVRYSKHWNVVEEVAFQHVTSLLALRGDNTEIPCVGGDLS